MALLEQKRRIRRIVPSGPAAIPAPAEPERFTFFWRGPLSQWHLRDITVDGEVFDCNEQFQMVMKARLFGDHDAADRIMRARRNPKLQKAIGREVRNFDERVWVAERRGIVLKASIAKFSQHDDLHEVIMATQGTTLVEASPYDRIYGIGLSESDPRARSRDTWQGLNLLGDILTETRDVHLPALMPSRGPR